MPKLSKEHLSKINSKIDLLDKHFKSALKKIDLADFHITGFTIQPKSSNKNTCVAGTHPEWTPGDNGEYSIQCVPD